MVPFITAQKERSVFVWKNDHFPRNVICYMATLFGKPNVFMRLCYVGIAVQFHLNDQKHPVRSGSMAKHLSAKTNDELSCTQRGFKQALLLWISRLYI